MSSRGLRLSAFSRRIRDAAALQRSNILPAFLPAAILYLAFAILFLLIYSDSDGQRALVILHFGAACSLLLFWRSVRWGKGNYDAFGSIMLLIAVMLKFQAAIDAWGYGARLDEVPRTVPWPEQSALLFIKAEALSHFGTIILVAVWRITVGEKVREMSFLRNYRQVGKHVPWVMYAGAIGAELLERLGGLEFGAMTQLSSLTYSFGVVSIYFIAARQPSRHMRMLLAIVLAIPMVLLALGGGMKEAIFFPLVPAASLYWVGYRGIAPKALAILIAILVLAYSQMYVHYVRDVSWGSNRKVTTGELINGFRQHLARTSLSEGMDDMSARINMTLTRAITVAIADARGFEPGKIFGAIPASLVPRLFWPGKPVFQPGAEHTLRVQNVDMPLSKVNTATAAGFFSELYLGGGYVGWLLGVIAYGFLLAGIQLFALNQLRGFGHLALSFTVAYWALRFEEKHIVYAYTSLIFTFIFLFLALKSMSFFRLRRRNRPVS